MSPLVFGSKPRRKPGRRSNMEERLIAYIARTGLPMPVREMRFHPHRKWRFDFAWPDRGLAVECEGGVFIQGGHSRGIDYTDDCEKYNEAALLGWYVLRVTIKMFEDGSVFETVQRALATEIRYLPSVLVPVKE